MRVTTTKGTEGVVSHFVPVVAPVTAKVSKVYLRLFPRTSWQTSVDEYDERPWAWGALCLVTFRIGELTTTKRVRTKYTYTDQLGWATDQPSDTELAVGRETVLNNLRIQLARHGFEVPPLDVIEVEEPATNGPVAHQSQDSAAALRSDASHSL